MTSKTQFATATIAAADWFAKPAAQDVFSKATWPRTAPTGYEAKQLNKSLKLITSANGQPVLPTVHEQLANAGRPLDQKTRSSMESRLGQDFSAVRIHADNNLKSSTALAYTVGSEIVFAAGQYAPETCFGTALLAHELSHVRTNLRSGNSAVLHYYESPEHQDLGDASLADLAEFLKTPAGIAWANQYKLTPRLARLPNDPYLGGRKIKAGSVELTPGDVIALVGDFYRTPQALAAAPPSEIRELLDAMHRERVGELPGGKANAEYQKITLKYRKESESYLELAKENAPHFTPTNREQWKKLHKEAMVRAARPAEGEKIGSNRLEEALLMDAGAGHFLTDAFASGHLFNKRELEIEIVIYLRQHPPQGGELQAYYGLLQSQGAMADVVLKNIHDRLNAEGLEVSNKKGMKWRTFGDNFLKNAKETRHIAALAVYLSRQQVVQAAEQGTAGVDPEEILELLPDEESVRQATAKAIQYIPEAVQSLPALLYRQRSAAGVALEGKIGAGMPNIPILKPLVRTVVPALVQSNLETIASPGREKQLEDIEERSRRTGRPEIAPSFTVVSF